MNTLTLLTEAGLNETFWGKRIIAGDNDGFTQEDFKLAGDWTTCACGLLDGDIPRDSYLGSPLDVDLEKLGMGFFTAIEYGEANLAAEMLIAIEKRAAIVLIETAGS